MRKIISVLKTESSHFHCMAKSISNIIWDIAVNANMKRMLRTSAFLTFGATDSS